MNLIALTIETDGSRDLYQIVTRAIQPVDLPQLLVCNAPFGRSEPFHQLGDELNDSRDGGDFGKVRLDQDDADRPAPPRIWRASPLLHTSAPDKYDKIVAAPQRLYRTWAPPELSLGMLPR